MSLRGVWRADGLCGRNYSSLWRVDALSLLDGGFRKGRIVEGLSLESLVTRRPAGHILPWKWIFLPLLFGSLCPVLSLIHLSAAHHAMWRRLVTGSRWASCLFIYARIVEGKSYFNKPHFWFIPHLRKAK